MQRVRVPIQPKQRTNYTRTPGTYLQHVRREPDTGTKENTTEIEVVNNQKRNGLSHLFLLFFCCPPTNNADGEQS